MEITKFSYLIINFLWLAIIIIFSLKNKIQFYKSFKYKLPAVIITSAVLILWHINFVKSNVWHNSMDYTIGKILFGLPIEEIISLVLLPLSLLLVYEYSMKIQFRFDLTKIFLALSLVLIVVFGTTSYYFRNQAYTFTSFLFSGVYLAYIIFRNRFKPHITNFYISYFLAIIPFMVYKALIFNLHIVEYNKAHIFETKIFKIPVEEFAYLFLITLMVTTIYETLKENKYY